MNWYDLRPNAPAWQFCDNRDTLYFSKTHNKLVLIAADIFSLDTI